MGVGQEEGLPPERPDRVGMARSEAAVEREVEWEVGGGGVGGVVGVGVA